MNKGDVGISRRHHQSKSRRLCSSPIHDCPEHGVLRRLNGFDREVRLLKSFADRIQDFLLDRKHRDDCGVLVGARVSKIRFSFVATDG